MKKAFKTTLSVEPIVTFHDPKKAQWVFIDDDSKDSWRKFFWQPESLAELSQEIGRMMFYESDNWKPFLEGYGTPSFNTKTKLWELNCEEFGLITIDLQGGLEVEWEAQETEGTN